MARKQTAQALEKAVQKKQAEITGIEATWKSKKADLAELQKQYSQVRFEEVQTVFDVHGIDMDEVLAAAKAGKLTELFASATSFKE